MITRHNLTALVICLCTVGSVTTGAYATPQEVDLDVLPVPTGTNMVGRSFLFVEDANKNDRLPKPESGCNTIAAVVYYPAIQHEQSERAKYMDPSVAEWYAKEDNSDGLPADLGNNRVRALVDPQIVDSKPHPLVIFSHGHGVGPHFYSFLMEELASQGFIVIAPYHTFAADMTPSLDGTPRKFLAPWPEGSDRSEMGPYMSGRIDDMAKDISYMIDIATQLNDGEHLERFKGCIDLENIAVCGHSLGGAAAGRVGMTDKRVDATVHLDSSIYEGQMVRHNLPLLLMNIAEAKDNRVYYRGQRGATHHIEVRGADHMSFSDILLLMESAKESQPLNLKVVQYTRECTVQFLNKHLRGGEAPYLSLDINIQSR